MIPSELSSLDRGNKVMEINPRLHQISRASVLTRGKEFEVKYEEDILKIKAYSVTPTVWAEISLAMKTKNRFHLLYAEKEE